MFSFQITEELCAESTQIYGYGTGGGGGVTVYRQA